MKTNSFSRNFMRFLGIVLSLALVWPVEARIGSSGQSKRLGAGVMVGSINSVTGKYLLSESNAIDFGLAFAGSPWTILYADYLWNFPGIFGNSTPFARQTIGYFGAGGGLGLWGHSTDCYRYYCGTAYKSSGTGLYVRAFFGAEWSPMQPPLGVFAEIGPAIGIVPGFGGTIDLGIGVRYFF